MSRDFRKNSDCMSCRDGPCVFETNRNKYNASIEYNSFDSKILSKKCQKIGEYEKYVKICKN